MLVSTQTGITGEKIIITGIPGITGAVTGKTGITGTITGEKYLLLLVKWKLLLVEWMRVPQKVQLLKAVVWARASSSGGPRYGRYTLDTV